MNKDTNVVVAIDEADFDLERCAPPVNVGKRRPVTLRGGADDDDDKQEEEPKKGLLDKPSRLAEDDQTEGDDDHVDEALVTKPDKKQEYPESSNTEKSERAKKKRIALMVCCCLILLLVLLLGLGLGLSGDDSSISSVVASPTTGQSPSPTSSPEVGVTEAPTTDSPTVPFGTPTSSPTIDLGVDNPSVSRLPCELIREEEEVSAGNQADGNFALEIIAGDEICADVFAGPDPERPNRNHWHASIGRRDCPEFNFQEANEKCQSVGARLCGANEVANLVAQGKGCGSDNYFLWTQSACETEDGEDGYYQINVEFRLERGTDPFFSCVTDTDETTVLKCCGDNDIDAATAAYNEFFETGNL